MASLKKTSKTNTSVKKNTENLVDNSEVQALQEELQEQKAQNEKIMGVLDKLMNKISELENTQNSKDEVITETKITPTVDTVKPVQDTSITEEGKPKKKNLRREYVTIVHLLENYPDISTHIELTGCTIDFHTLGEERSLTWSQFEELAGKFKQLFDMDIIALSEEDSDLVERYNLKTIQDNMLNRFYLENLPNMKTEDLEALYNKLSSMHKKFIIGYWQRKFFEGDPRFKDRRKIELLNALSHEGMQSVVMELNEASKRGQLT